MSRPTSPGMLAGGLTKSNIIGVVGAMPIPEVNRLVNAYIAGAKYGEPDRSRSRSASSTASSTRRRLRRPPLAQIGAGADVLYAERDGVIEAAQEKGVLAIGNMSDQKSLGARERRHQRRCGTCSRPSTTSINQVAGGTYTAQDLGGFSSYAKGGASLAPINTAITGGVPQELIDKVKAQRGRRSSPARSGWTSTRARRPSVGACSQSGRLTAGSQAPHH